MPLDFGENLCKDLKCNQYIETLSFSTSILHRDDIDDILRLAVGPGCSILHVGLANLEIERLSDYDAMRELANLVNEEECYKHKVQSLDFRDNQLLFTYERASSGHLHDNLDQLTQLAERLPYLHDVGVTTLDAINIDVLDVLAHDKLKRLGVQLDKNQVGRVLLHPQVLPTIPIGLWAVVLWRAANIRSKFLLGEDLPPLDGLYYLIQKLIPTGVLHRTFSMAVATQHDDTENQRKRARMNNEA